jgi:hypothetical protein
MKIVKIHGLDVYLLGKYEDMDLEPPYHFLQSSMESGRKVAIKSLDEFETVDMILFQDAISLIEDILAAYDEIS